MIRKIIWTLLLCIFFAGFVFIPNSSARPWPKASPWIEDKAVGIPHTRPSIENRGEPLSRASLPIDGNSWRNDGNNNRVIVWLDFLMLEIKRVNGR